MNYLFTSESVSEGHPDKLADQISDAILDNYLAFDPESKVACEILVTTGQVIITGEVYSKANPEHQKIIRDVIKKIGYTKDEYMFSAESCGILSALHSQSQDIRQSVDKDKKEEQGAGDQGMMFGFACSETDNYMPVTLEIAHLLVKELASIRQEGQGMKYLRPDAKSQVTVEYNNEGKPQRIDSIVVSTQHDDFDEDNKMLDIICNDVKDILIPRVKRLLPAKVRKLFNSDIRYYINPSKKFIIGGPHGDTGLTGRKIVVDTALRKK